MLSVNAGCINGTLYFFPWRLGFFVAAKKGFDQTFLSKFHSQPAKLGRVLDFKSKGRGLKALASAGQVVFVCF